MKEKIGYPNVAYALKKSMEKISVAFASKWLESREYAKLQKEREEEESGMNELSEKEKEELGFILKAALDKTMRRVEDDVVETEEMIRKNCCAHDKEEIESSEWLESEEFAEWQKELKEMREEDDDE